MDTKKLRQKILDLAIHGKLVPQDPNDEPASVLLERIRAEKEQLIKEGKIKAPKKSKTAGDTSHYPKEGLWELPEGWCWSTIGETFNLQAGKFIQASDIHELSPQYLYPCYGGNGIRGYVSAYNRDGVYPIVGRQGALCGNINYATGKFYATEHAVVVETFGGADVNWTRYLLEELDLNQYATATAQPGLSVKTINEVPFPLPPSEEQKRIAGCLKSTLEYISQLEGLTSSLCTSVSEIKAKVLDLAIHGKLVPQNLSDEPAMELLRRINPAFKPSHNLHYEGPIPVGWQLTKMGDLVDIISGTSYQKTDIVITGNGIRILRGGNIQNGGIFLCDDDVFINASLTNDSNTIHKGDIAIVASTGSSELIGKAAIATRDYPRTQIGAFLRIARPKSILISEYLGVIFQSDYYKSHIKKTAKGTNINNIKTSYLTDFIIPIPPREEQGRIMCKIRCLLAILNQITDSVNSSE